MTRTASPTVGSTVFESPSDPKTRNKGTSLAWVRRFAGEPFVQFTMLGALAFAGHRLIARTTDAPTIEVSTSKQRELTKLFEQRHRRAPNETERKQLVQRYVEDEVLFREGMRLSVVHTDPGLRAQIVARVRGMFQSELEQKPPSDSELQRFYEEHHTDYASPETISYREYWIHRGSDAGSDARRLMEALRTKREPDEGLPTPTDYSARSEAQLISLYDEEVARSLRTVPSGSWHELRSERGIHVVRVDSHTPASQPSFAEVRERVSTAYRKEQTARALQAKLSRLTSQWHVNVAQVP